LIGCRDEGLALLTFLLFVWVMERLQGSGIQRKGKERNDAVPFSIFFPGPPLPDGTSLVSTRPSTLEKPSSFSSILMSSTESPPARLSNTRERIICSFRPPLGLPDLHMGADVVSQAKDRGEIKIDGEACKGRHACVGFLFFVLVGKNALWHTAFTSLVIGLVRSPYSIIPCIKGQRGFSLFLMVDRGARPAC